VATLNWIGKEAVVNHDKEVPFKLLEKVQSASVSKESKNLIIHGDNLEALKALMPFYQGKVKCIYIDPPYNTGNEGWVYNDKVNSPKIREWLKKVVGRGGEDLTRHDKWLCMMYPRLKLLRDLLKEDGVIFVSIDDNEQHHLRLLMDEIMGENNFITTIVWSRKRGRDNSAKYFSKSHEYVCMYARNISFAKVLKLEMDPETEKAYKNPDNDKRGPYRLLGAWARGTQNGPRFEFISKNGKKFSERMWLFSEVNMKKLDAESKLTFVGDKVYRKLFRNEHTGSVPETIWDDASNAANASDEIKKLFGSQVFDTPKPTPFIERILKISTKENDLVLDSFAGSGTTAEAVITLNKSDGGNRKFILIEMENKVAKSITANRIKKVIKRESVNIGFEYCDLAKPLFNERGQINEACSYDELATYVYFTETQTNINKKSVKQPFVGKSGELSYYLIYAGKNKNDLTRAALSKLKIAGPAVIYADRCLVDEAELKEKGITFKQIPYEIKVY
jgi:adenine specific DNA methylase Mod